MMSAEVREGWAKWLRERMSPEEWAQLAGRSARALGQTDSRSRDRAWHGVLCLHAMPRETLPAA